MRLLGSAILGGLGPQPSGERRKHDEHAAEHDRVPDGHDQADEKVHAPMVVAATGGLHGQKVMVKTDDVAGVLLYDLRR